MASGTDEIIGESQIKKLFAGSTVLITGGTGFIGKLLVEKLLRSCTQIEKIYLLARPKKGKDIDKRLEEQFKNVLYDKLREQQPDFTRKVVAVKGDIQLINLGLNEEDRKRITEEVSFIFHGAATVRFNEPLKKAVQVNVRGTREMLLLAKACPKLKAFVHISTAYGNCKISEIDEVFYGSQLSGEKLIDLMEDLDEAVIDRITPEFIRDFPNTYSYSKLAAEDLIKSYSKSLPVAVIRPAVVTGTEREPLEGWIDNVYGPLGAVVGGALGVLHVLKTDPDVIADMVPGDMVINGCIAAAWKVVKDYSYNSGDGPPQDCTPPIYNFVSSEQSPITWGKWMSNIENYGLENIPSSKAVWHYSLYITSSNVMYKFISIIMHWIPAYIVDFIAVLIGRKPILIKLYKKIENIFDALSFFGLQNWKFHNHNARKMFNEMCDVDKNEFNFDMSSLDWDVYCQILIRGVRLYITNDPFDTVPQAKKLRYRLKVYHYILTSIVTLIIIGLFWAILSFVF